MSAAFSSDGQRVLTASWDGTARVWDAETGRPIAVLQEHGGLVSAAFSPDGRRVVTGSWGDETARIWDAETGRLIVALEAHERPVSRSVYSRVGVSSVAFSTDGRRVVAASQDTAWIWDAESGRIVALLQGNRGGIAALSPDGRRAVTTSGYGEGRIWRVFPATQDLVDAAKGAIPRCLTREQRTQAFLNPEPPAWCIEMEKWPYQSHDWKDWLKFKRAHANPPLPDTAGWKDWIAARR